MPSPVGILTAASDGEQITGLWIAGQKYYADTLPHGAREQDVPIFASLRHWLAIYFSGKHPDFLPPLAPTGSAFRHAVWKILGEIPYGEVMTYGDIAQQLAARTGQQQSAQAVGGAVGHNPISILIPCHRVVGADGSLTGYAGGLDAKVHLLRLEGAFRETFYVPTRGTAL